MPPWEKYQSDGPWTKYSDRRGASQISGRQRGPSESDDPESGGIGQTAGLAGRVITQAIPSAVLGLPALAADAYDSMRNLAIAGSNKFLGTNMAPIPAFQNSGNVAAAGRQMADTAGFPQPQTRVQQGLTDIGTAGLSAVGGAGLARIVGSALPKTIATTADSKSVLDSVYKGLQDIADGIATQPVLQGAAAVGGATATDFARNAELSPAATVGLGIVGSMAPGGATTVGQRAAGGARALAQPFRQMGREEIAGTALNRLATNRNMAPIRMDAADELVPGSQPTIAQTSRDPGLIGAEKVISQTLDPTGRLAQRASEQNAARQNYFDEMLLPNQPPREGQTPRRGTLQYAEAKRDDAVSTNMNQAFARAPRDRSLPEFEYIQPIFNRIDEIRANPRVGARKDVQDALKFAEERLTQPGVDIRNPEALYAIRKDLAYARDGKYNSEKSNLALAKGELAQVIKSVDSAIEAAAPGYRRYMELYAARSKPLNQQDFLTQFKGRSEDALTDKVTQSRQFSPDKFNRQFQSAIANGAFRDANVSDQQIRRIQRIADDLDRGAALTQRNVRSPGSDTMRNLSVANFIGKVIGDNTPDTAMGRAAQATLSPLSLLYRSSDEAVGQILLEAALDPRLASRLMREANRREVEFIANELARRAASATATQGIYGNSN